jgi:chloramphenicol 3-O phosphotransferase
LARVVQTHFDIIVDLVLRDEAEFQACLKALSARTTYLIGVTAPLDVLEMRERLRDDRAPGIGREQLADPVYQREYDLVLDTSKLSPEVGAAAIRKLITERSPLTALGGR